MAFAKSQAYQDAANAPATRRAYATDWANFAAWCDTHGFMAMPATPEVIGAYLAAAGEGYALLTLRRRVAAIVRACRIAGHALDTKHPSIREALRGIGRKHGVPARRSAALTAGIVDGPIFRKVNRGGTVEQARLTAGSVRDILLKRASTAGVIGTWEEPVSPHGLRAGFVTAAYRNGVPDEEIMGHTRHRSLASMRTYVRRAKLGGSGPSGKVGL